MYDMNHCKYRVHARYMDQTYQDDYVFFQNDYDSRHYMISLFFGSATTNYAILIIVILLFRLLQRIEFFFSNIADLQDTYPDEWGTHEDYKSTEFYLLVAMEIMCFYIYLWYWPFFILRGVRYTVIEDQLAMLYFFSNSEVISETLVDEDDEDFYFPYIEFFIDKYWFNDFDLFAEDWASGILEPLFVFWNNTSEEDFLLFIWYAENIDLYF